MKFIGQLAATNLTSSTGLFVQFVAIMYWLEFHWILTINITVKNPSQRATSSSEQTRQYLRRLDNKTIIELIEVYKIDFEMFQYSPEGYYM